MSEMNEETKVLYTALRQAIGALTVAVELSRPFEVPLADAQAALERVDEMLAARNAYELHARAIRLSREASASAMLYTATRRVQ